MSASFQRVPNLQIPSSPSDRRLRWSHHHRLIPPSLLQHRDAIAVTGALRSVDPRSGIRFLDPVVLRSADGGPRRRRGSVVRGCALGARVGDVEVERRRKRRAEVVVAAAMTALLGTGNRVLYKLALVPLKQYPFFLAQLATFGYVVVYFSILYARYHSGIVTDEMLSLPKTPYLAVGLLEALGAVSGMAAGAVLSGASIPILSQTFLVWQLLLSVIFLGRRYRFNQILGCFLVTIGVVITVASGSGAGDSLKNAGIFWALLMIISFLFQAADTVLKETIFLDAAKKLEDVKEHRCYHCCLSLLTWHSIYHCYIFSRSLQQWSLALPPLFQFPSPSTPSRCRCHTSEWRHRCRQVLSRGRWYLWLASSSTPGLHPQVLPPKHSHSHHHWPKDRDHIISSFFAYFFLLFLHLRR
ncbi:protein CLT1, chloroplastic-like isoform X2 [Phoenix dactylifera]|uniref:Protein CLT1, chloroplastic-like isoform X2 n=1 Tax=Phoenix dactylifera TaxID=42345 RepID=A0A8B9AY36_PHODC|nr:protein CLT1, chloroplastic-like isoform X2 [Phoenix dactylifera]